MAITISKAYYPEAPFIFNNKLHYVEYTKNRIVREDGWTFEIPIPNAGPCGLASINNELIVACYDAHVIYFLETGKCLSIPYPNDMINDDRGGIFVTSSASCSNIEPFSNNAFASGSIYYIDNHLNIHSLPIGRPIHYANGIAYSHILQKLYVSEHLQNRILSFDVTHTTLPKLENENIYINLPRNSNIKTDLLGPDGISLDDKGNMYVAHFGSGNLLIYDSDANLQKTYLMPYKNVTNVSTPFNKGIYVTVANDDLNLQGYVIRLKSYEENA